MTAVSLRSLPCPPSAPCQWGLEVAYSSPVAYLAPSSDSHQHKVPSGVRTRLGEIKQWFKAKIGCVVGREGGGGSDYLDNGSF